MKSVSYNFEAAREAPRAVLQEARNLAHHAHPDWIYFLPTLHFCACLMSTLCFFVPGLQYLSVMWDFVVRVDFPISLLADALGPHYNALAAVWIVVAGTLWWYLISFWQNARSISSRTIENHSPIDILAGRPANSLHFAGSLVVAHLRDPVEA
jgi:hypothetical protein